MDDAGGDGVVVAFEQVIEYLLVQGRVSAGAGRLDCLMGLAEDGDDVAGPGLQPAGAELGDRAASPDHVGRALLDAGQPAAQEVLIAGVAVGDQVPGEAGRQPGRDGALAAGGDGLQERQPPVRGPGDQHMRRPGRRLAFLLRVRLFLVLRWGRRGRDSLVQDVHRGLVGGQHVLACQRRDHRVVEPGLAELRRYPRGGLVRPAGRDRDPHQHAHDPRGAFRRHVPVTGQQHRGGVQHRPVRHRARVRARRRLRERDRPAARARKTRQRPLGHRPDDLRVDNLRPLRARGRRPVQGRLAGPAFCRRIRVLPLAGVRVPPEAFSLVTGLPATPAVPAALPLGLLPGPARLLRPDPFLRAGRPGVRAVHRQPALHFRQPQLHPPP